MRRHKSRPTPPSRGFTLVELMVVVAILGILAAFVLSAAVDGVRRAEGRATQELIIKLDTAVTDRIEALMSGNATVTNAHILMASIPNPTGTPPLLAGPDRAQVIAQVDRIKAELPDTFFVQVNPANITSSPGYPDIYPLNFAAQPWPLTGSPQSYFYPLGAQIPPMPGAPLPQGIYGASYAAAAAVYKNLGYAPQGYDQRDNDSDGFIDEWDEGVPNSTIFNTVVQNLQNHLNNPHTARAEMLYAILVEGTSPLGSKMNADDFRASEIKDTDGDGLPEFVDAWGQPIQFYRWPTHYKSDTQKGAEAYVGYFEPRQTHGLDPNQQLVAPAWWTDMTNPGALSAHANIFQYYFFSLMEPNVGQANGANGQYWDRSGFYERRSFFCRPLIISSGPDKELGLAQLAVDYRPNLNVQDGSGAPIPISATNVILIENEAAPYDPLRNDPGSYPVGPLYQRPQYNTATTAYLQSVGLDDLSNHTVLTAGGGVR